MRQKLAAAWRAFDDRFVVRVSVIGMLCAAVACATHEQVRESSMTPAVVVASPVVASPPLLTPPQTEHFRVMIGGDLLPHRPQLIEPASLRNALAPLGPLFHHADVAIANYETATGDLRELRPRTLSLAATPEWTDEVRASGLRAVTVANNHSCDLGKKGLTATLEATSEAGLVSLGAGVDPWAPKVVAERDGRRVCVVAWTTFSNEGGRGCVTSGQLAVSGTGRGGETRVRQAIARATKQCDAVIAVFHGGEEYVPQTRASMSMGEVAADAGAVAVVIHHPHVVSPMVVYSARDGRHVPIYASVGNLVSNQGETWEPSKPARQADRRVVFLNAWTRLGMLADLDIAIAPPADAQRRPVVETRYGYHLVWTDNDHYKDKSDPHPRIETHVLDDAHDAVVVERLVADKTGPSKVFTDICKIQTTDGEPSCR